MFSRYLPKLSGMLATRVEVPYLGCDRKLAATSKGNLTLLVVNEGHLAADASIKMEGMLVRFACIAIRVARIQRIGAM